MNQSDVEFLARLNAALAESCSKDELSRVVVEMVKPVFGFDAAILGMVERDGKTVTLFLRELFPEMLKTDFFQRFMRRKIVLEGTPFQALLALPGPIIITPAAISVLFSEFASVQMLKRVGVKHILAIPLRYGSATIGFLNMASKRDEHFHPSQFALCDAIAERIAYAAVNLFSAEHLHERDAESNVQHALASILTTERSLAGVAQVVAQHVDMLVPASFVALSIASSRPESTTRENITHEDVAALMFQKNAEGSFQHLVKPIAQSALGISFLEKTSLEKLPLEKNRLENALYLGSDFDAACRTNPAFHALRSEYSVESALVAHYTLGTFPLQGLPQQASGEEIHAMLLLGERQPYGFEERDAAVLERLAPQIALTLTNALAFEQLARLQKGQQAQPSEKTQLLSGLDEHLSASDRNEHGNRNGIEGIIGTSLALQAVLQSVRQVAPTTATVLIHGETGTGKERIARTIHALSPRYARPFVVVNCAALPLTLIESELFGHEKGAFTGATERRTGKFEAAHGGTIFLDEIGELPLDVQAKLLRALQEREIERVGGKEPIRLDVRVVAATNRNLAEEVAAGRFRADVFYRLNVFPVVLPPLRDRREDIPLLAAHFARVFAGQLGRVFQSIADDSMSALLAHPWHGNIRELENVMERAAILCTGDTLRVDGLLTAAAVRVAVQVAAAVPAVPLADLAEQPFTERPVTGQSLTERPAAPLQSLDEAEREHILAVLERTSWRVSGDKGAARILKMKPTTLEYRMKKLGIQRGAKSQPS